MSETEQSSNPIRKTRVKTEDDIIRQILKLQNQLMKNHKIPSLFTFSSKYGQLEFGSDNVLTKFRSDYRRDDTWAIAFEEDDHEVVYGDQGL